MGKVAIRVDCLEPTSESHTSVCERSAILVPIILWVYPYITQTVQKDSAWLHLLITCLEMFQEACGKVQAGEKTLEPFTVSISHDWLTCPSPSEQVGLCTFPIRISICQGYNWGSTGC